MFFGDVGVNIQRGRNVRVTEEVFYGDWIHSGKDEICRAGMPEHMRRDARDDRRYALRLKFRCRWVGEFAVLEIQLFQVTIPHDPEGCLTQHLPAGVATNESERRSPA